MNKAFRIVWSETKQLYEVVSELVKSHGKPAKAAVAAVAFVCAGAAFAGTTVWPSNNTVGAHNRFFTNGAEGAYNYYDDQNWPGQNNSVEVRSPTLQYVDYTRKASNSTGADISIDFVKEPDAPTDGKKAYGVDHFNAHFQNVNSGNYTATLGFFNDTTPGHADDPWYKDPSALSGYSYETESGKVSTLTVSNSEIDFVGANNGRFLIGGFTDVVLSGLTIKNSTQAGINKHNIGLNIEVAARNLTIGDSQGCTGSNCGFKVINVNETTAQKPVPLQILQFLNEGDSGTLTINGISGTSDPNTPTEGWTEGAKRFVVQGGVNVADQSAGVHVKKDAAAENGNLTVLAVKKVVKNDQLMGPAAFSARNGLMMVIEGQLIDAGKIGSAYSDTPQLFLQSDDGWILNREGTLNSEDYLNQLVILKTDWEKMDKIVNGFELDGSTPRGTGVRIGGAGNSVIALGAHEANNKWLDFNKKVTVTGQRGDILLLVNDETDTKPTETTGLTAKDGTSTEEEQPQTPVTVNRNYTVGKFQFNNAVLATEHSLDDDIGADLQKSAQDTLLLSEKANRDTRRFEIKAKALDNNEKHFTGNLTILNKGLKAQTGITQGDINEAQSIVIAGTLFDEVTTADKPATFIAKMAHESQNGVSYLIQGDVSVQDTDQNTRTYGVNMAYAGVLVPAGTTFVLDKRASADGQALAFSKELNDAALDIDGQGIQGDGGIEVAADTWLAGRNTFEGLTTVKAGQKLYVKDESAIENSHALVVEAGASFIVDHTIKPVDPNAAADGLSGDADQDTSTETKPTGADARSSFKNLRYVSFRASKHADTQSDQGKKAASEGGTIEAADDGYTKVENAEFEVAGIVDKTSPNPENYVQIIHVNFHRIGNTLA